MVIYKVTENANYDSHEEFFKTKEDARKYMDDKADEYLRAREDLFIDLDVPRNLHLRIGDPNGDSGLYAMFAMTEIIVH